MQFTKGPRFNTERLPDPPPPTTASKNFKLFTTNGKPPLDDRYAVLLKRIDDLERVHADDKKNHQAELDRHKSELACATRTHAEQADKLDKLKRQHDAYEARVQELTRAGVAEQSELKDLRTKLRVCEHERQQLAKREAERAALAGAETRRKEQARERERRVAELEKTLAAEKKRREILESGLDGVRKKGEEEAGKLRVDAVRLRQRLEDARREGEEARRTAEVVRGEAEGREEELLMQVEHCRVALSRVADEYARLVSTTVTAKAYDVLREEHLVLRSHSLRLERKLANSEAQVTELAHLIRHATEENRFLLDQLRDAEEEVAYYSRLVQKNSHDRTAGREDDLSALERELVALSADMAQGHGLATLVEYHDTAHIFYRDLADELLSQVNVLAEATRREQSANRALVEEVAGHIVQHEASNAELLRLQTELTRVNSSLASEQASLAGMHRSRDALQDRVNVLEKQLDDQTTQHKVALQKERDIAQKLSTQFSMSKMAEAALKAEIENLNGELADASRFQDAYYKLLDETEGVLARNDLAEEEAERLSQFNAEILGHHNPAQRIVYVDRIRRELADTKQKLLVCTRERDALVASNDDMCHEIELYKSSVVPIESKPRSAFIRVSRPPLASQSVNAPRSESSTTRGILEHLPGPGDMTVDELI